MARTRKDGKYGGSVDATDVLGDTTYHPPAKAIDSDA